MSKLGHLCELGDELLISKTDYQKLISGQHKKGDPYRCGSCHTTFSTICVLHVHLKKHSENGSYHFDSCTQTAFPKFDSTCAYSQVEDGDIKDVRDADFIGIGSSSASFSPTAAPQVDTVVRKSNRIAARKEVSVHTLLGKKKNNRKTNPNEKCRTGDNFKSGKKCKKPNTHPVYGKEEIVYGQISNDKHCDHFKTVTPSNYSGTGISTAVNGKKSELVAHQGDNQGDNYQGEKSSKYISEASTDSDNDDESYLIDGPYKCSEKDSQVTVAIETVDAVVAMEEASDATQTATAVNDASTRDITQKTDELTASEVLLAMSKGTNEMTVMTDQQSLPPKYQCPTLNIHLSTTGKVKKPSSEQITQDIQVNDSAHEAKGQKFAGKKKSDDDKKRVECKVCGKVGSRAMLTYHKYLHMEKKSFTCDKCGSSFQHPQSLQMHLRQHEEKQFCCGICHAAFHRKQYLDTHMLKHSGENPHMCDHCGKSYRDPNHLKRHIRHVHENRRNFECDICLEKFFRSDHLKNHRLRHFEADKKCSYCKKMFRHPNDLHRHILTHTGEKKWHCHLCNHGFVAVSPYYAHMSNKHGMSREDAKQLKSKLQDEYRRLQKKKHSEVVRYQSSEIVELPNKSSNSFDEKDLGPVHVPYTKSEICDNVHSLSVEQTEFLAATSRIPYATGDDINFKTVTEQILLPTQESHISMTNESPLQESLVAQREAGCQTSEYDRNEAALELVQLQRQTYTGERPGGVQHREKVYQADSSTTSLDGKRCFYVYNDLTGVGKEQTDVVEEFGEGMQTETIGYRVIQTMDMGRERGPLQQEHVSNGDTLQLTEVGDFVVNRSFGNNDNELRPENGVGREMVQEVGLNGHGLDIGQSDGAMLGGGAMVGGGAIVGGGAVLTGGAEMAMMMQVSGTQLMDDGGQTVMFIDDNQCASEVVIHMDQIGSL